MERRDAEKITDSESDNLETGDEKGFSIDRAGAASQSDWTQPESGIKRSLGSPDTAVPGSKNVKMTNSDSDTRRGPGSH